MAMRPPRLIGRGPVFAHALAAAVVLLHGGFLFASAQDPEPAAAAAGGGDGGERPAGASEEVDETKQLLDQLTIAMVSEVVDERTFETRDTAKSGRKRLHIRLGNVAPLPRGAAMTDAEHEERAAASKAALGQLVAKQMVWYKAAPDEHQPPPPPPAEGKAADVPAMVVADVWLIDGRHVNGLLVKQGHVAHEQHYHTDLARNILTAEANEKKQDSYKALEEALKESEKEKKRQAAELAEQERLKGEPIGFAGWLGLGVVGVIVMGALVNFGRDKKKKVNLNRKRGPLERLWMKLKGA